MYGYGYYGADPTARVPTGTYSPAKRERRRQFAQQAMQRGRQQAFARARQQIASRAAVVGMGPTAGEMTTSETAWTIDAEDEIIPAAGGPEVAQGAIPSSVMGVPTWAVGAAAAAGLLYMIWSK